MPTQNTNIPRKHKSERLGSSLMKSLRIFIADFPSMEVAAEKLTISRNSLSRILSSGTAKTDTITKIKAVIQPIAA